MKVYRIAKTRYADDLSGIDARMYGGRWNRKGTSILYTSENRALATVVYLVHAPLSIVPANLSLVTLQIPDNITPKEVQISDLPSNWRAYPPPLKLAELGTNWAKMNQALLLRVPSAVVEGEFNILIIRFIRA
ncbi:MAG: RES family NAD+ phosphorylase [candidate division KSB1 bacterium]|nr:RES family NAD+ phosphorylase [candidate division KSB1 bacterium]MDZ7365510.1 RES family NAD+ phosphorylase [candidate division KSB1 bacterium]MDZ7403613.1 RES family NAD+ phosphorylase [candidate division KSB1 bacterium]